MSVRKNFSMPEKVAKDLEYLSKKLDKKQSQIVQELIEEKMAEYEIEKKLEAAEKISGSGMFTGMFPEHVNIQWIKANSDN
jgi:predicted DNA-binding protein